MPQILAPMLRRCLERANPNVASFVEISARDQGRVLHRADDQFLASPPQLSQAPANTVVASPNGALTLLSTSSTIVNQFAEAGDFNIPQEDGGESYINTVGWRIDPTFGGGILRQISVRVKYLQGPFAVLPGQKVPWMPDLKLRIFRAIQTAETWTRPDGTSTVQSDLTRISFADLLQEPLVVTAESLWRNGSIDGSGFATVVFDLTPFRIAIDPISGTPPGPGETGQQPEVFFSLQTLQQVAGNLVAWRYDTTSSRTIAGIGDVRELSWTRAIPSDPSSLWLSSTAVNRALTIKIDLEAYVPTSQLVYQLDLDALPDPASTGRVVFNRGVPSGTSATLELSTTGAAGAYAAVANGDAISVQQLTYHVRLTLNASADSRRAPFVNSFGVEFRSHLDYSPESTVEHMSRAVAVPFLASSVGEGRVTLVRAGRRDYRDLAGVAVSSGPDTQLEADIFLGSRHPQVTRDDWFHMARARVSNRVPTATDEQFTLLSVAKALRKKIPELEETINVVHTVVSATPTAVTVSPVLKGASTLGNEYDGKDYWIRIRSSSAVGFDEGATFTIAGNTGVDRLDFSPGLGGTLNVGDVIEVHSGQFVQPSVAWFDQDPADIWWELLTLYCGVPADQIGFAAVGGAGRAGLPPRVEDRAPGDIATQDTFRVTRKISEATYADELIDQLSFIMGGATIEIGGQFVFRQIYPLRDANGVITVPLEPVSRVFDARDYASLETPIGRENRLAMLSCTYGVDSTIAKPDAPQSVKFVDVDAVASLGVQDVEAFGAAAIPDSIAAWCYNSAAGNGFALASALAQQVIAACSTGIRVWPWTSVDAHPDIHVGDTVVIVTNQYTDYDPRLGTSITGWRAYTLTIVATSAGGRRFGGFLQGLSAVSSVDVRGGHGTLQDTRPAFLSHFTFTDTETQRIFTWVRSAGTHAVWVYDQLVAVGGIDGYEIDASLPEDILLEGTDTYTAHKPPQGFQRFLHFVPRTAEGAAGDVQNAIIDPAPSALAGTVKAAVTNAFADLTLKIEGGASNWPVTVDLFEDNPDGASLLSTTVSAPTVFTSADFPVLAARPLPLREVRRWYMRLTDTGGLMVWGIGSADRDALPNGSVTRRDYRADPDLVCTYDDDTDQIRVTLPDARTKTFTGLTGSGVVTYTVGDVLDDASTETLLATDEVRTPYLVEFQGGGTWVTFFDGPLHGVSSKPPIAHPRFVLSTNRDTADVYVGVESPVAERVRLFVRNSESFGAPEYGACVGVADPTPLFVSSGSELGPTSYFTDGASQTLKLAAIALTRDQIKRLYLVVEGEDSGVRGSTSIALGAMEQPWLESISATWDELTGNLNVTAKGGAHCASALFEVDDNSSFSSPYTASGALADGAKVVVAFPLSGAEMGKVWYARVTPYNLITLGGLPGVAQLDECFVQSPVTFTIEPTESGGNGTLTVVVADPSAKVHASLRVSFAKTQLGTRTLVAATTSPGSGTSGTYTYTFALDPKHPTLIETLIHMADGSTLKPGAETFDADKVANVVNVDVVHVSGVATITASFDTDTATGSALTLPAMGPAQYAIGAGAWVNFAVNASTRVGTFTVTMTGSAQTVHVRGINSAGVAGPAVDCTVGTTAGTTPAAAPGFSSVSFSPTPDYTLNTFDVGWVPDNVPAGTITYNVKVWEQKLPAKPDRGEWTEYVNVTSPFTYTTDPSDIDAAGIYTKIFKAIVTMIQNGLTVAATSATIQQTLNSNT